MPTSSDPRARAERAMQIAIERGWLDPARVEAVLRLNAAWGKDAIDCALEASWITVDHAAELRAQLGAPAPPSTLPTTGQRVGPYRLERALGSGSMGTVFVGLHLRTQARHAVKLVPLQTTLNSKVAQRFLREGQALARLDHPGVVKVYSCAHLPDSRLGLLALELVQGDSLEDWLAHQSLPYEAVVDLGRQLAEALVHIHAAGIVHRDLKPENLLIRAKDARLVVCDFGVARDEQADSLTHTGQLLGSPAYMAPEQISGDRHAIGPATDVYAWSVVLYRLVANALPFDAPSLVELASHIVAATPTPLREHRPDVPPALAQLIAVGLSKAPSDRPSAAALVEALQDLDLRPRRRVPPLVLMTLLPLIVLALASAWFVAHGSNPPPAPSSAPPTDAPAPPASDPRAAWRAVEALPPRARYAAAGSWLSQNPGHAFVPSAVALRHTLLRAPLSTLRVGKASGLEFLDDDRLMIAAAGKVLLWDIARDQTKLIKTLGTSLRIALSADRSTLAVSSEGANGRVTVHATSTLHTILTLSKPAAAIALSHDGTQIALANNEDLSVVIHTIKTGALASTLPPSPVLIRQLEFTAQGDLLVAVGALATHTVTRWTTTGEQVWTTNLRERPTALLPLPNDQVLVGTVAANVSLHALSTGALAGRFTGKFLGFRARQAHSGNVATACLVPGRPWVVTGSAGGRARHSSYPPNDLRVWDPITHQLLHTWRPRDRDRYRAVTSSPRGDVIAVACPLAGTAEVWLADALSEKD